MRIFDIRIIETTNSISLFAKCKIRHIGVDDVHFTFDKRYKSFLYNDASPFAAALLLPSMKQGEDLIINGKISKQLYDGMQKIIEIVSKWDIGLKPINIKADEIIADIAKPTGVATFFSGGVDSFYTYLKHKKKINHLLLVNGYDIDPHNKNLWSMTQQNIEEIAVKEKVGLIEIETNIRPLIEPILPWDYTHGGCLAAAGLCLRKKLNIIYIPSSYTLEQQFPWGSNFELDHLWGTEKLTYIHDGTEASRVEKVAKISHSSTVVEHLRVCYMNEKGKYNCGKCGKCLRTMVNLYLAGILEKTTTFPHKIDVKKIIVLPTGNEHDAIFDKENLIELQKRNLYPKLQEALIKIIPQNAVKKSISPIKYFINRVIYLDHIYIHSTIYKIIWHLVGKKY
ncbi:MAG: hypothetical protein WCX33_01270 [Candidatus Shapirobacteria bacterium]